jgi:hypothetical protein
VREASRRGYLSEIISTPLFCDGDESCLLERLNGLAPTTFLSGSRPFVFLDPTAKRQIAEGIRTANIVRVHTLRNPINTLVRLEKGPRRAPNEPLDDRHRDTARSVQAMYEVRSFT